MKVLRSVIWERCKGIGLLFLQTAYMKGFVFIQCYTQGRVLFVLLGEKALAA